MAGIGIVGAGTALGGGRMLNSVAHHHATVEREQAPGVDHWDSEEFQYFGHHHYISGGHNRWCYSVPSPRRPAPSTTGIPTAVT